MVQTLYLSASESVDDDQVDGLLEFKWNCTDDVGADCKSPSSTVLDMDSFASGELLTVPAGTLPSGRWIAHMRDAGSERRKRVSVGYVAYSACPKEAHSRTRCY